MPWKGQVKTWNYPLSENRKKIYTNICTEHLNLLLNSKQANKSRVTNTLRKEISVSDALWPLLVKLGHQVTDDVSCAGEIVLEIKGLWKKANLKYGGQIWLIIEDFFIDASVISLMLLFAFCLSSVVVFNCLYMQIHLHASGHTWLLT